MSDALDRFRSIPATWDEVKERMRHGETIRPLLEKVTSDGTKWMTVYRSKTDAADLWAVEFPYSEAHGGGPPCFYPIKAEDAEAWLVQAESFTVGGIPGEVAAKPPQLCQHQGGRELESSSMVNIREPLQRRHARTGQRC